MAALLNWNAPEQAHFERSKFELPEREIESLARRRDGFAADADFVADKHGS